MDRACLLVVLCLATIIGCQPAPVVSPRERVPAQLDSHDSTPSSNPSDIDLPLRLDPAHNASQEDSNQNQRLPLRSPHEDLDAVAWVQTSAEYPTLTRQIYRAATERLPAAIADPMWSACPLQSQMLQAREASQSDGQPLPPAVILDIDETVLDNSDYQVELVEDDAEFSPKTWDAWVERRAARPVPGVKSFLDACNDAGVAIFFITNRDEPGEDATRDNLSACELFPPVAEDRIYMKRERDEWVEAGSDKQPRRDAVTKRYRLLMIFGDDLNDFLSVGDRPSTSDRRRLADAHAEAWGEKWFMLPNPNYGGWERALYNFDDSLPREEKLFKKRQELTPGGGGTR